MPLVYTLKKKKKDKLSSGTKTKTQVPMSAVFNVKFRSVWLCYAIFSTYVPTGKCFSRKQSRILRCITGITEHAVTFHILPSLPMLSLHTRTFASQPPTKPSC
jgi:hypothetical protein